MWTPVFAEQSELSGPQQILQQPVFGREINCLFNGKKHCYCLHGNKSNSYSETFAMFCFLSEKKKSICSLKTITDHQHIVSSLYLLPYMVPPGLTWTKPNLCS